MTPSAALPILPSPPLGRSTVIGGNIEKVDPVQDHIRLKVSGGRTITLSYDERTRVYQNGTKISVLQLHSEDHASIETILDGADTFALRIHMLTEPPNGQIHGQVISYDPNSGTLKLRVDGSNEAVTLSTPDTMPIARVEQEALTSTEKASFADLVDGSLVDVTFSTDKKGSGVATHIDIIAIPGTVFTFCGNLTSIDIRAGRMSIVDTSNRPKDISFDPARFPMSHDWRENSLVRVRARFDGSRFVATDITPKSLLK